MNVVLVAQPEKNLEPILKNSYQPALTEFQSHQNVPAIAIDIRTAVTSSPSSPESPEHQYSQKAIPANDNKAGDQTPANNQHENQASQKSTHVRDGTSGNHPHKDKQQRNSIVSNAKGGERRRQAHTVQQNDYAVKNPTTDEPFAPIFSAVTH